MSAAEPPPILVFEHVTKRFGAFRLALANVSVTIARSEFVVINGPNGAGKSTLLRLAAGLDLPSEGRVLIGGAEPAKMTPRALAFLRRSMGIVLQDPMLLGDRSVIENVMLAALAAGRTVKEAESRARAALARVGLDGAGGARPFELSGGQQQRAALARAIVNRPVLVLVDEPTAHLDADAAGALVQLLEQFAVGGVTVLLASQDQAAPVPARARRLRLRDGRLAG